MTARLGALGTCLHVLRSLLVVAALVAMHVEPSSGTASAQSRAQAAERRVRAGLERDLDAAGLRWGAPLLIRIFKLEGELEVWVGADEGYRLFRTYPICAWSGELGPKLRRGDRQSPEGFYEVGPRQLNPASRYHLAFDLGYPNAYDRAQGRTGDFLMVHGRCESIGCYAMGDAAIEAIYTLVAHALAQGQRSVPVHAFPFRFDRDDVAQRLAHPHWGAFWQMLREGFEAFERHRRPPRIDVRGGRYRIRR